MMEQADFAALGLQGPSYRIDPPIGPRDVASILDNAVADRPLAEALVDETRRLNYADLDRMADAAGHWLRAQGIAPGDRIAASLPNGADIAIAFLASQRVGAIWVGINRVLSPIEKEHILRHSESRLFLTDTSGKAAIATVASTLDKLATVAAIDDPAHDKGWVAAISASEVASLARAAIDPFSPAVIMYTSGTTGAPKGVVHSQHNLIVVCAAISDAGLLCHDRRLGVILPLTITNLMVLGPLMAWWNGQACVCGPMLKATALIEWIERERIGFCAFVPTIIYDLLQTDLDLPDHYRVQSGGAPLPLPIRAAFRKRHGYPLASSYGLTEAPAVVAETGDRDAPFGTSGLALPHLSISIRDAAGVELPLSETGEVCVGAVSTGRWANVYVPALGYWRDSGKSAALLCDGVLHTGDMGRLDENGWLYLADRSSELILRAGSNIYPGEIEQVLHEHAAVSACALIGQPDPRLGMRTVAFVQPADTGADRALMVEELSALCRASLARYKVPDRWIFVDAFQRNAMGKIVKPALRERLAAEADEAGM